MSASPQLTAILDCADPCAEHGVQLVADGGIRYSGDVAKAIAAGASAVMIGNLLAGTDASPGEIVYRQGERYKEYRGMGSIGAMVDRRLATRDRYGASTKSEDTAKLVAEGVEAQTPYRGPTAGLIHQLVGGLCSSMGYVGAPDISCPCKPAPASSASPTPARRKPPPRRRPRQRIPPTTNTPPANPPSLPRPHPADTRGMLRSSIFETTEYQRDSAACILETRRGRGA